MARDDRLDISLQDAVLAVLAFDERYGPIIAGQVREEHFDGAASEIAKVVLRYYSRYSATPGAANLETLFTAAQIDPNNDRTRNLRETLVELHALSEGINGEYVTSRTNEFVRRQVLKSALMEATERYAADEDGLVDDVEGILHKALSFRQQTLDAGVFLGSDEALSIITEQDAGFYPLNIRELDRLSVGLTLKEMLLYIAPKGSGKSWFCVHAGRSALTNPASDPLLPPARVVHISLEMSESRVVSRYYQSFFGLSRKEGEVVAGDLEMDKLGRLIEGGSRRIKPKGFLRDPKIRRKLKPELSVWGPRLDRLVVKSFPTGSLTIPHLESYLDYLESERGFVPTVLIVDYPDLMAIDVRYYRLSLGRIFEELRGIGNKRNLAIVAPTQGSRQSLTARTVRSSMVAEDIRKVNAADTVLTYSQTSFEKSRGLGRLMIDHARNEEGGSVVVMSQSYGTGQYVLQSAIMSNEYWDQIRKNKDDGEEDDED